MSQQFHETPPVEVGEALGSYRLVRELGRGGMGQVFLAEHVDLGRRVALKVLSSPSSADDPSIKRFYGEGRAVNQVAHPHIVQVTDLGYDAPRGVYYMVMEYLVGRTLAEEMSVVGALPAVRALRIARQLANALDAVHRAGIVHRDLKPENIFLVSHGGCRDFVKLLDFGIAKFSDSERQVPPGTAIFATDPGLVVGTPAYLAPEQGFGQNVDARTDVYALGVLLYEMVTGRLPFEGDDFVELVLKHAGEPPRPFGDLDPALSGLSKEVESFILQCLGKEARERPQDMGVVEQILRQLLGEEAEAELVFSSAYVAPLENVGPSSGQDAAQPATPSELTCREETDSSLRPESLLVAGPPRRRSWPFMAPAALAFGALVLWLALFDEPAQGMPARAAALPVEAAAVATPSGVPAPQPRPPEGPLLPAGIAEPEGSSDGDQVCASRLVSGREDQEVSWRFDSVPPGATVWRVGDASPLGVTPFTHVTEARRDAQLFEWRRPGFWPERRALTVVRQGETSLTLRRLRTNPAPPSSRQKQPSPTPSGVGAIEEAHHALNRGPSQRPSVGRRGVLDPFASLVSPPDSAL
jgi:serine/threonine protein kinase